MFANGEIQKADLQTLRKLGFVIRQEIASSEEQIEILEAKILELDLFKTVIEKKVKELQDEINKKQERSYFTEKIVKNEVKNR